MSIVERRLWHTKYRQVAGSFTTVIKKIKAIASEVRKPRIIIGQAYEMDDIRTFVGRKDDLVWIAYALNRSSGMIADFRVGNRTNKTLSGVTAIEKRSSVFFESQFVFKTGVCSGATTTASTP